MPEGNEAPVYHSETHSNAGKWILIALAIAYVAGSSYLLFDQHSKLEKITQDQSANQKQVADISKRMQSAEADAETLAQQLGMTKKELAARAEDLQRQQLASVARLAEEQKKELNAVAADARTLEVAKDRDRPSSLLGYLAHERDGRRVLLMRAVREVDTGDVEARVHQASQRVATVDAQIAAVQKTIADALVVAPLSGIVTAKIADVGELLAPRAPIVVLTDAAHVWANVYVDEPLVPQLRLGLR